MMTRFLYATFSLLVLLLLAGPATAQNPGAASPDDPAAAPSDSWYPETSAVQLTPQMIIQQKAQTRAYQRMARIESMKWYGMSASRPLASTTPFMGVPSPRWQMPGGRPFAWTPYRGTSVYIVR